MGTARMCNSKFAGLAMKKTRNDGLIKRSMELMKKSFCTSFNFPKMGHNIGKMVGSLKKRFVYNTMRGRGACQLSVKFEAICH